MELTTSWRQRAVLIYFAIVFVISWGGVLLAVGPGGFPPSAQQFGMVGAQHAAPLHPGVLVYLGILAAPFVAGILLIALSDGR